MAAPSHGGAATPNLTEPTMIILGVVLIIVGFLIAFPILITIGVILAIVGVVLMLVGTVGHRQVGGRSHWF